VRKKEHPFAYLNVEPLYHFVIFPQNSTKRFFKEETPTIVNIPPIAACEENLGLLKPAFLYAPVKE